MGNDQKPTKEQLQELYQQASVFKEAQPWNWLCDVDIICVENPVDKTMGYCSIMGRGGQHYALGVYLGNEGLCKFYQLLENMEIIPNHQVLHYHNCLMCSFEDRDLLTKEDRKQIKDLGLSFRGRDAWPMFRRYEPGYNPWFITAEECIFLTHALRQTLCVADDVFRGQLKMDMEQGGTIVRSSEEKNGKLKWYSEEVTLEIPSVSYRPVKITDDTIFQEIKKARSSGSVTLQTDICYVPTAAIKDKGDRPYFPRIYIVAESKYGQVLDFKMYENLEDDVDVSLNRLVNMFLQQGVPKEIQVRGEVMTAILGDFCKKAGIKLKRVKHLNSIDEFIERVAY